jgi:putative nucleotidyltransferase with HDIG domain
MQPYDNSRHESAYAAPDQLRIGLYVYIDLPWFLHPFTLNSFSISSEEQIAALRALNLQRFRIDPTRSEGACSGFAIAAPAQAVAQAVEAPEQGIAHRNPLSAEKQARAQHLREHRRAVAQTEKSFVKATGIMHRLTRNLLLQPKSTLDEMYGLVDQMTAAFLERAGASLYVMGEKCGGDEAYFHGLNVSILSMMLAKDLDLSAEQARLLGAGALLHDIGRIRIPDRVLRKDPEEFTRPERELYASHVEYGVEIGKQVNLAPEALEIVAQHHEMADGSGYPRHCNQEQTAPLARIVSLANYYDNLCNPVVPSQAMTPHEALSYVFARRRDKFDARVLQLMIRSLGVYPPGCVVRLSNDAIAMVTSVNPNKALRPWVLLYDASVPRHEAVMLDLEQEPGVSIAGSLRPALLPPAVHAYLSPRRRITYFFDSGAQDTGARA